MKLLQNKTKILQIAYFAFEKRTSNGPGGLTTVNYLLDKVKQITYIEHPFITVKDQNSYLTIYKNSSQVYEEKVSIPNFPEPIKYFYHFLITIYFIIKSWSIYDLCIGCGNFSFLPIIPFRILGIVKKNVYYTFDYTFKRFSNPVLNRLYFLLDRLAYSFSDVNWVMNEYANINRKKNGFNVDKLKKPTTVPIGYSLKEIPNKSINKINYFRIIFSGALLENNGPQLAIETMPLLLKDFPNIKLIITGGGPYEEYLKKLTLKLKLKNNVTFMGFLTDYSNLLEILTSSSIGLAPFKPNPESISNFADSSKTKLYLSCHLPVIITSVNPASMEIDQYKAGLVINFDKYDLYKAIKYLLEDKKRYETYRNNAIKLALKYDINNILDNAFEKI